MITDMSGRLSSLAAAWIVVLGAATLLGSCTPPVFPRELFTISADGADYPVMLSRAPAPPGARGRKIQAASGTHAVASQSTYVSGRTTVTYRSFQAGESELPASAQLSGQVQRADKWLQIDRAEFNSEDFANPGSSSAVRRLIIDGTVYR